MKHNGSWYCTTGLATVAIFACWIGSPAFAQNDPGPDPAADEEDLAGDLDAVDPDSEAVEAAGEVIVITGSRIRTGALDNQAPILPVSREDLDRTGLTSVADVLQRLPASGGALNSRFNSSGNSGFPPDGGGIGAGAAQADLRYLGSKRVLVLVDGVRWVNGASASGVPGATDLNTIPYGIIERIEVLQDGASAIYGSDAIAGVINIITRKDLDGVIANAYIGSFHQGDGVTQQYDVSWGNRTDRLSLIFNLSVVDQTRVSAADREISRYPVPGFDECTPGCSSGTPQGRFVFIDPNTEIPVNITLDEGIGRFPRYDSRNPGGIGDDFNPFDTIDRFNFAPYNLMVTPSQRIGAFTRMDYKITPRVTAQARALFNARKSVNQAAPEPLFIGSDAGTGTRMDTISVDVTNPYNPLGFTLDANDEDHPFFIGRRPLEAGPRIFQQNVNTFYLSGGLEGNFDAGSKRIFWDATAVYSINRADQLKNGAFNSAKLQKALGPLDDCLADPECVPFNIFGGQGPDGRGTITQEMLDYVTFVQKDLSEQQLFDLSANISGELFRLPGGPLGMAAGVEHRRQEGFFQPDPVVVAGDSAGVPSSPTDGSFISNEAYAEIRVPLLAKLPGADLLDLSGAVRVSDYSTFGAQQTLKIGARWRPIADLMLRGNYAQGFRAPGIGELFGTEARFDQNLADPCSDMLGRFGGTPAPQSVVANCINRGVPSDGSYVQFNSQISVTTGGNSELQPETSDSYTLSLVYSPSWLERNTWIDNLDFELTYFRIDLDEAIQAIDAQVQLNRCIENPESGFCEGISRTPSGVINGFDNQLTNIGGISTDGLDLTISYVSPATDIGRFRVTSLSNLLLTFRETIPSSEGFEEIIREGTEVGDPERAFPTLKSSLIVDWFRTAWRASWTVRYINAVTEPCTGFSEYPGTCSDPDLNNDSLSSNQLGARIYNDVQLTWTPEFMEERFDVTLGVNNILNQGPPLCYSCALNGFDASTYDVPGVFGYLKASYRM